MYGMTYPQALAVFGMFALAGWLMWLLARAEDSDTNAAEIDRMLPVIEAARHWSRSPMDDAHAENELLDAIADFEEEEANDGA